MKNKRYYITAAFVFLLASAGLTGGEERWWSVYFTSYGKDAKSLNIINPEKGLVSLIAGAKKSFYGAFFELSSGQIADALEEALKRGVEIKLVTDDDNLKEKAVMRLKKAGIPVVPDNRSGLMHNKFAVVDDRMLWTGSYNLSDNGARRNNNNAVLISSPELASIYLDEFREMFEYNIFGNRKEYGIFPSFTKKYYVKIGDTDINAYFSPEDNVERIILKRLQKAKKSIHFMAFSFTSDKIGEEMIRMARKGVKVYGLLEKTGANSRYSEYIKIKLEGIPVKLDRNRYRMHHKVIVIDGERLITGSYNFSKNANTSNDENILIIDNREIAGEYLKEFDRLYK